MPETERIASRWGAVAVALALVLAVVAVPSARAATGFALRGEGCTMAEAIVPTTVGTVGTAVPPPFKVFDYGLGAALARLKVLGCERLFVDGRAVGPGAIASVAVDIEPPLGAPGASVHSFEVWRHTSNGEVWVRYADLGFAAEKADVTLEQLVPFPLGVVTGSVASSKGDASVVVAAPDPTDGLVSETVESAWQRTPRGPARTYATFNEVLHAAAGGVQVGGDMGGLVLLPVEPAAGFVRTFSFKATVQDVALR
jgi:hypothetical protein